jgi:hypothetical protein
MSQNFKGHEARLEKLKTQMQQHSKQVANQHGIDVSIDGSGKYKLKRSPSDLSSDSVVSAGCMSIPESETMNDTERVYLQAMARQISPASCASSQGSKGSVQGTRSASSDKEKYCRINEMTHDSSYNNGELAEVDRSCARPGCEVRPKGGSKYCSLECMESDLIGSEAVVQDFDGAHGQLNGAHSQLNGAIGRHRHDPAALEDMTLQSGRHDPAALERAAKDSINTLSKYTTRSITADAQEMSRIPRPVKSNPQRFLLGSAPPPLPPSPQSNGYHKSDSEGRMPVLRFSEEDMPPQMERKAEASLAAEVCNDLDTEEGYVDSL